MFGQLKVPRESYISISTFIGVSCKCSSIRRTVGKFSKGMLEGTLGLHETEYKYKNPNVKITKVAAETTEACQV